MKRIFLSLMILYCPYFLIAQNPCLPNGIIFTTQEQIDSFQVNYPGCTEISNGELKIEGDSITNLEGLSVLTSFMGFLFTISNNPKLTSLSGIHNISLGQSLFDLNIINNDSLLNLEGMTGMTFIGDYSKWFTISDNDLLVTLSGFPAYETGDDDRFIITDNESLVDLTGIESADDLEKLEIINNDALTSLSGLENITHITSDWGGLIISGNDALTSLTGLDNLKYVWSDQGIQITGNDNLQNLDALSNAQSFTQQIIIKNNPSLSSISGISNILLSYDPYIGSIKIINNDSLSECHIQNVCSHLISNFTMVQISGNAQGCTSPEEVQDSCLWTGIRDQHQFAQVTIHPNPSDNGSITITLNNTQNLHLTCFNTFGQQVHQQEIRSSETVINVSTWSPGIYLAVIYEDGKPVGRSKFVVW